MKPKMKNLLRSLLVLIPGLYLVTSLVTHCGGGTGVAIAFCDTQVNSSTSANCQSFASSNSCGSYSFSGDTCTLSNCTSCTCDGTVSVSSESDCTTYGQNFGCATATFANNTCTVTDCNNCETVVDDSDFVVDVDDAAFDDF